MADISQSLLVFYDLEWSNNEIIQIGAACGDLRFSTCLRLSGKIDPFVRKKIKLDLRLVGTERQVYDMTRSMFLPTVAPLEGLTQFLTWLRSLVSPRDCNLILVSHGNADILVLDRNFSKFDLEEELYALVHKFIDFQEYLATHFKDISSGMGLKQLLSTFCPDQNFRFHCADEDSLALQQVFLSLHSGRGIPTPEYLANLSSMRNINMRVVTLPKNCKQIKGLAYKLNPGSEYVLLPNIYGVYNIFGSSPLFDKIERPDKFQFDVSGYVVRHARERFQAREETRERTHIELACYIGNAYFKLGHLINTNVKSVYNLVRRGQQAGVQLSPGQPVSVTVLVTNTNFVKVVSIEESPRQGARQVRCVDIERVLRDLTKGAGARNRQDTDREKENTRQDFLLNNPTNAGIVPGQAGGVVASQHKPVPGYEIETDVVTLARRQKQVDYCKRTRDYQRYLAAVPKSARVAGMPATPDMNRKHSRRQWDGAVKLWKTQVHSEGRKLAIERAEKSDENPFNQYKEKNES